MIWIVRDSADDSGEPLPYVSVWSVRPKRWALGDGYVWSGARWGNPLEGWLGSLWLDDAWRLLGTTPDDDRQMVTMERDPVQVEIAITKANRFKVPKPEGES